MRLAVFGSRCFKDYKLLSKILGDIWDDEPFELVSGGAEGADTLAEKWYVFSGEKPKIFKPDYKTYGDKAPLIRNKQIAEYSDNGICFWDGESRGTMHTMMEFVKQGKQVNIIGFK